MGALGALGFLALAAVALFVGQRRLIYFPDEGPPAPPPPGWEEASYETEDGLVLDAWYREPDPGSAVVIVFNGNAGNRGGRLALGEGLADAGLGVLLTDYRGYGGNPGRPTEDGLAADARAALHFVQDAASGSPIAYYGESLGAAVAVGLATAEPPAALVLRSPFTSLAEVGRFHYPWLPVSALLRDRYPSIDRIGSVHAPTLIIAGEADSIIPVEQSMALFDAAPDPKRLHVIPGADHNDAVLGAGPELIEAAAAFIAEAGPR